MRPPLRPSTVFVAACAATALAALTWIALGEAWPFVGLDGSAYLRMARGLAAEAPFGHRALTPALAATVAHLFGLGLPHAFAAVSLSSLVLTGGVLGWLGLRRGGPRTAAALVGFWCASFPMAYLATTELRADAPALLAVAVLAGLVAERERGWAMAAALVAGVLAHEMALFALAALGIDALLGTGIFAGRTPSWKALAAAGLTAGGALAAVHLMLPVLPASVVSYDAASPVAVVRHVLAYTGGPAPHALRIYAAFGPALLFAAAAVWERTVRERAAFALMSLVVAAMTLLATDTLRVAAVAFVPVLGLAAAFVVRLVEARRYALTAVCAALQITYAALVYGHLRTFEGSWPMHVSAAALSMAAMGVCLLARRTPSPARSAVEYGAEPALQIAGGAR